MQIPSISAQVFLFMDISLFLLCLGNNNTFVGAKCNVVDEGKYNRANPTGDPHPQ